LTGSSVIVPDGEMGIVRNFLLDDRSWAIHYVVTHVGTWHKRRGVVLPVAAVEQPYLAKRIFHAHILFVRSQYNVAALQELAQESVLF
jgi:hypothetical protein